jgi:hypothetical protein
VDDEALERLGDELDARRRRELSRTSAQPLPAALQPLAKPSEGRYGICCSGGGIRSAAFNLGALQVLQAPENRILQRAKYLAAVSGGSYMAAGFAMVAKVDDPETDSDPDLVDDDAPPFHPGSPEEQYLRNRSSYMAPGFGGKLRLVARVILGVLVNLLYLGSILFVVGWIIGWLLYGEVLYEGLREARRPRPPDGWPSAWRPPPRSSGSRRSSGAPTTTRGRAGCCGWPWVAPSAPCWSACFSSPFRRCSSGCATCRTPVPRRPPPRTSAARARRPPSAARAPAHCS